MACFEEQRREFMGECSGHSNFLCLDEEGMETSRTIDYQCYSEVSYSQNEPFKNLFILFPKNVANRAYKPEMWCDWVINRSFVADAFITKGVSEGMELGFQVDTKQLCCMSVSGMVMLRCAFEQSAWAFSYIKELGFSDTEAYALSVNLHVQDMGGKLIVSNNWFNTNHILHPKSENLSLYSGKFYNPHTEDGTLYEGRSGPVASLTHSVWSDTEWSYKKPDFVDDCFHKEVNTTSIFGGQEKKPLLTKTGLKRVLKQLKEL
jgi:hypothetical protein